tara:strand:- start:43 stop:318 length:276 start_codon:yes stop_codon:yes gene_type:complete
MLNIIKITKAIKKINPNAEMHIIGDDIDTCTINWLEDTTPISKEDIKTQMPIVEQEDIDKNEEQENLKASARQKLMDGEPLTEDEAKTIVL